MLLLEVLIWVFVDLYDIGGRLSPSAEAEKAITIYHINGSYTCIHTFVHAYIISQLIISHIIVELI